jgi:Raf kinase inhibitor-like YbhB/YbcL family protein
MHFAKPMLQSLPLFTVGWHVGQSLSNVVFSVPEPLAVLPAFPIVARLLPRLGAKSGNHGDRDLNVGLRERRTLSKDWSLRKRDGERYRKERDKTRLHEREDSIRRPAAFFRHETNQKETAMKTLSIVAITAFAFLGLGNFASAQAPGFQVNTTSFRFFRAGENPPPIFIPPMPIRLIYNRLRETGENKLVNECSPDGARGENQSPGLTWTHIPRNAKSFAVIVFDSVASVHHWGMYNIPTSICDAGLQVCTLPENAGVAGSTYGQQTVNVYGRLGYGGPCPPPNDPRGDPHEYVFTAYALAQPFTEAQLPLNSDAAALAEALLTVKLADGTLNTLASDSIVGRYSSTPP